MAQTTHTQSITFGNNNANCSTTIGSYNTTTTTIYNSDEDAKIMGWLSPLESDNRHHSLRTDRFGGVGDWLSGTSEFREWNGGEGGADQAVLFCSGDPGVGKTHLSSLVIDRLCDQAREGGLAVAWLYCDYNFQQEQTVTNIIGAILKRLVRGEIPEGIREAFQEGRRPPLEDLMRMLKTAVATLPRVFICIDALDECLPKDLPKLLELLRDIVQVSPRSRIFLTGRSHVVGTIQKQFIKTVVIPITPKEDDIKDYVAMRLDRDDMPEAMDDSLRAEIMGSILEKMSNVFLLASLNIEAVLGEVTIRQRRKKLQEMERGNGLRDAYTATLSRLKAQNGSRVGLGLRALMWVSYLEKPLRAEQLCHALGVEIGSTNLDLENVPAIRTLLSSCLGLLTVEASSSIVRLVHFTLQEHFLNDPTIFQSPHSAIAEVCLTYLNFGSVRDLSPTLPPAPSTMPFLEYASLHWAGYTKRGMTENVRRLALQLLDKFDEHISAQFLLLKYEQNNFLGPKFRGEAGPVGFTGLHGGAYLGIGEVVATIMEMKESDANASDCTGSTALTWAAYKGHEEVVKILLQCEDVNPNHAVTKYGWTPLVLAAERGHEGVAKMLLERKDVNPDQADTEYGLAPLSWAAKHGHEGVVKMLLERDDVRPDRVDTKYGRTSLAWAAEGGHEVVVRMLLGRDDLNPDQVDTKYGRTPLSLAAARGHEGVVKMLLERDNVNPDQVNTKYGRTPLSWAAAGGHEGVAKMLLERNDVNPAQVDTQYGRTPLSWAAAGGHQGVVRMFLERNDINPDQADTKYGRTPLSLAASRGHEGVVKILLERDNVNPHQVETEYGRTPLSLAAGGGHEGAVKIILERNDVNPNQADTKYGRTPLSWAAEGGHQGVAEILLKRNNINPDQVDTKYGLTPLSWAAVGGHEGMVKMLLERNDVNPDQADTEYGRTPLSRAAARGYEGIVNILLERNDVNPNHADTKYGRTPLTLAAERAYEGIVKILLKRNDINPDQADTKYGRTPLSYAAAGGHEGIVKMLLERNDVNPDQADTEYGRTPLSMAAAGGHEGVVRMLFERDDVNPDHVDTKYGWTPLSLAAARGREKVVKMLLERDNVNPHEVDPEYGRQPMSLAAARGHEGVVKILLERNDVNPDQADAEYGLTPLSWAAVNGHEGILKMLLERNDVNPDQADTEYGRKPLSWAAARGYQGIVKILLERGDINPDQADTKYGRTPLSLAAERGYEGVVKMLLERNDVNPEKADTRSGRTPLSWATAGGHYGVVKMLLEQNDINPEQADTEYCREPLSWATEVGHEEVVKGFLELNDVRTTIPDDQNHAPPPAVLPIGHYGAIDIPIKPDHLNSHPSDISCQAPPSPSADLPEQDLVEIKFSSPYPDTDIKDSNIQPPLPPANSIELVQVPEPIDSVSASPDALPATEPSMLLQLASLWPLNSLLGLHKSDTPPDNTRSALPILLNRYLAIGSCLCLLVTVVYRKNSPNRTPRHGVGTFLAGKALHLFLFVFLKLGLRNRRWRELLRSKRR